MSSALRRGIVLLAVSSMIQFRAAGQTGDRNQTDTTVADTVVVGDDEAGSMKTDSVAAYDGGSENAAPAGDSLLVRKVPDSVLQEWKRDPVFAYANDPRFWQRAKREDDTIPEWLVRLLSSNGFRYGIYIILGALLIYAIGRIVTENQLGIFYRGARRSGDPGTPAGEEPLEVEDIDRRLEQSVDARDFRQAIRYSYLRILRRMDAQGLIHFHGQTTNQEYLRQLTGTDREASFRFLTYAYEKVWYGEFGLSEENFRRLMGYFSEFDKTLPA